MPNKKDLDARELYHSVMEEVKVRILSINIITNSPLGLPSPLVREYCFLQLRMVCELIALGCLIAHGDIQATQAKDFTKAYKADDILRRLEELHPEFFPIPSKPTFGNRSVHFDIIDSGFITKAELITLYRKCGDVLHKGNLRNLISSRKVHPKNYNDISDWSQKILNLLSVHRITRIGGNFHFLTFLEVTQAGGNVQVAIAESPDN